MHQYDSAAAVNTLHWNLIPNTLHILIFYLLDQHHLGHNRERNAILRKDTPRAREEQLREDEESARAQTQIEIELAEQ